MGKHRERPWCRKRIEQYLRQGARLPDLARGFWVDTLYDVTVRLKWETGEEMQARKMLSEARKELGYSRRGSG